MGFLKTKGEIYKAVEDVDVGPNSNQFYLTANVKGLSTLFIILFSFIFLFHM